CSLLKEDKRLLKANRREILLQYLPTSILIVLFFFFKQKTAYEIRELEKVPLVHEARPAVVEGKLEGDGDHRDQERGTPCTSARRDGERGHQGRRPDDVPRVIVPRLRPSAAKSAKSPVWTSRPKRSRACFVASAH